MGRPLRPRADPDGATTFHALNRGNNRTDVFFDDADRFAFLDAFAKTKARYPYRLYGYSRKDELTPNSPPNSPNSEAANPGHVVGVNVPIRNASGQLVTDADILLQNSVIQVKSGGGKGLADQLVRTEQATGLPTIGFGPTLKPSVVIQIQKAGGLVTKDEIILLETVKP